MPKSFASSLYFLLSQNELPCLLTAQKYPSKDILFWTKMMPIILTV